MRSDPEWMAELGRRLRMLRKAQRRTIADVAREAGLDRETVSRAERGDNPTLLTLIRLLRVYRRLGALESFIPEPLPSPLEALREGRGGASRRGRRSRAGREGRDPGKGGSGPGGGRSDG